MNGKVRRQGSPTGGVSLLEVLVVLAIAAALLTLLLPALQAAREAARRAACQAHLREIGLGMLLYHAAHGRLPPGGIEWRSGKDRSKRQLSWAVFLLPQLELEALARQIDWSQGFDSPANALAAATVLPLFLCPSSPRGDTRVDGHGASDYCGINGERITSPNVPPKGALIYDHAFRLADVTDGASSTAVVAEDAAWPEGQWINGRILMDQAFAINAAPPFENDMRSEHPGGANAVFLDGTVRFLVETMDLRALASLCTREGDEPPWQ